MVGYLSTSVSKSVDDGGAMLMMAKESLKIFRGNVYGLILIEAFFAANATAAEEFPVINPFAGRSHAMPVRRTSIAYNQRVLLLRNAPLTTVNYILLFRSIEFAWPIK